MSGHPTTLGAIVEFFARDPEGFRAWWWRLKPEEREEIIALAKRADADITALLDLTIRPPQVN